MSGDRYIERTYRRRMAGARWSAFTVCHKESDLWIGIDPASFDPQLKAFALEEVVRLRTEMEAYLATDPGYAPALVPYEPRSHAPVIFHRMARVARLAGIGPMSAVAGAVASHIGEAIRERFGCREVVVENGGDIYACLADDLDVSVFAGESPLSERVGLTIRAEGAPLGICTSSGTVGPSLSFGRADAVMIVAHDCALADTYATAFANRIRTAADIDPCLQAIGEVPDMLAAICIVGDRIGMIGKYDLKLWK